VLGGLGAVLADGGIDELVSVVVSVVVVVVPVVPEESVDVVLVVLDSSLVVSEAQAARDIVATAMAAAVMVRSVAFMVILCCPWCMAPADPEGSAGVRRVAERASTRSGRGLMGNQRPEPGTFSLPLAAR
jgi:hypothetical protein